MRPPTAEERLLLEQATARYQQDLAADAATQQYLHGRGFTPQTAQLFRLGVVRRPVIGHERYTGRLHIPYITPSGVVNARFRCLRQHNCKEAEHPKYVGLEGRDTSLYNVLDLRKSGDAVCVTEGELDAIALSMCGLPAVGVPGATNWKKHFSRCLDDFATVWVFGDPDDAGKGLNKRLINDVRARPVRMPKGHDVNSLYLEGGADVIRRLIAG